MHEGSGSPRADWAHDQVGKCEARKRRDDDIVPVRCKWPQQPLEFEIRARPAVKKQDWRLRAVAFHMDEVEVLAFYVRLEVGQCVQAPFDRTPVIAVPPIRDEPLKVINPDAR